MINPCGFHYDTPQDYKDHMKTVHLDAFTCDQCMYVGESQYAIALHASYTGHASLVCKHGSCEKTYSRLDTLQRHQRAHQDDARRFPCTWCKKHQGKNGFKRKDHLTQHLRNYHHIGEDERVEKLVNRNYPCPQPGCDRTNDKAYIRKHDLRAHLRKIHGTIDFPGNIGE